MSRTRSSIGALKTSCQEELGAFLRAADGDRLAAMRRFAVRTGRREGEQRALQSEDLDRRAGAATIRRNLPAGITDLGEAEVPKTHAGGRTFRLSRALLADLEAHRKRQAAERLRVGEAYRDQDLVFCTKWGTALGSGNVLRRFRQLLKRAGAATHYVVHDLRHTAASVLIMRGTPLTEVAQILGHAGPHVTAAVYAHLVPRAGRAALEEVEAYYEQLERADGDGQVARATPRRLARVGKPPSG